MAKFYGLAWMALFSCSCIGDSAEDSTEQELEAVKTTPTNLDFGPFNAWNLEPEGLVEHFKTFYSSPHSLDTVQKLEQFWAGDIHAHREHILSLGRVDPMPQYSLEMEQALPFKRKDARWLIFSYYAPETQIARDKNTHEVCASSQWENTDLENRLNVFIDNSKKGRPFRLFNHHEISKDWSQTLTYEEHTNSYEITTAEYKNSIRDLLEHQERLKNVFYYPSKHALKDQPLFHYHVSFFIKPEHLPWLAALVVHLDEFVGLLGAAYSQWIMAHTTSSPWLQEIYDYAPQTFASYIEPSFEKSIDPDFILNDTLSEASNALPPGYDPNLARTVPIYRSFKDHYVGLRAGIYVTSSLENTERLGIEIRAMRPVLLIPVARWIMTLFVYALYHPDETFKFGRFGSVIKADEQFINTQRFSWEFHREQVKAITQKSIPLDPLQEEWDVEPMLLINRWTLPLFEFENATDRPYLQDLPADVVAAARSTRETYHSSLVDWYNTRKRKPKELWTAMNRWAVETPLVHYW